MYSRTISVLLFSLILCSNLAAQNSGGNPPDGVVISLNGVVIAASVIVLICCFAVWNLRGRLAALAATVNNVRGTVDNVRGTVTALSATVDNVRDGVAALHDRITQRATAIDQAVAEVHGGVRQLTPQLQQAVTNVQGSVTQATAPLQHTLTNLQAALTQNVADIQQSLGQLARSDMTTSEIERVRENIGLMRSNVETVLALTWSRLMAGMPPFAPQIQSIDPRDAPLAGDRVTIEGRNFSSDCRVWFGTRQAQPEPDSTTTTRILVQAPASQPGEVDVCVQSPNGLMSAPHSFIYRAR